MDAAAADRRLDSLTNAHRHKIAFSVEGSGAPSFSPFEKRVLCFIRMSIISRSVKHIERSECGKDLKSDETQHCFGSLRYTVLLSCSHSNRFRSLIYPRTCFLSLNFPYLAPERLPSTDQLPLSIFTALFYSRVKKYKSRLSKVSRAASENTIPFPFLRTAIKGAHCHSHA